MFRVDLLFRHALLATSCLVASTSIAASVAKAGGATGGRVVNGSATIDYGGDNTTINQKSGKAFINWQGFSIPKGGSVVFNQPNQNSLTVNRVVGPDSSQIFGDLLANGQIWLINSNGILFGKGSQIDVGALVATTSDITDQDFRNGHYRFSVASKNPNASVVNQGTIRAADGGSVVLSAARVSNEGVIQANLGSVVLGGANAFSIDFDGDNLIRYQVAAPVTTAPKDENGKLAAALVSNSGTIQAAGGKILMTARAAKGVQNDVINNTGIIEATSVSSHDGEIVLDGGDGTVDAGGTIDASGKAAGQQGGAITVTGNTVNVADGAKLDVSGARGGGEVRIGGDFHGGGTLAHAANVNVGKATIDADAISQGSGGKVAVWSDNKTVFDGAISARGGARGGNGGFVETSGKGDLQVGLHATVNTVAMHGLTGTWLLDPTDIDIITGGTDGLGGSMIDPKTITDALATTAVELEATHDITIDNAVDYTSGNAFTLLAENDIIAKAGIQNAGAGAVNLVAGWDGTTTDLGSLTNAGVYGNNGGSVFIGGSPATGDVSIGSLAGTTLVEGSDINVDAANGIAQIGYSGAGQGDIEVQATGNITVQSDIANLAIIGNGALSGVDGATIGGNILINAAGSVQLLSDSQDQSFNNSYAIIGNFGGSNASESGNITLNTAGNLLLDASGNVSVVRIGNTGFSGSGTSSGDINIDAVGLVQLNAGTGDPSNVIDRVDIGNGAAGFGNTGGLSGNININAGTLDLNADFGPSSGVAQARIGNRGSGPVSGDVNITTTGDLSINTNTQGAIATIGGISLDPTFGSESGDINIQAGGSVFLIGNDGGGSRIELSGNASGNISVTAQQDVIVEADADASGSGANGVTMIGTLTGNADISVTAVTGQVELKANGTDTLAFIGNSQNGQAIPIDGNVTITAPVVQLFASGNGAAAQIGNAGGFSSAVSGDVTVTAANQLTVGPQTLIGNSDFGQGTGFSGNVSITTGTLNGDLGSDFLNDIPNGDFTLDVTSSNPFIFNDLLDYTSSHNATLITGGDLLIASSIQNSGSGNITINAGGSMEIGGNRASGDVSVGSFGGLTTISADNILVDAVNGIAQIGYHGAGQGDIDVSATGNIDVQSDIANLAIIGNGGSDVTGQGIGGNIIVRTAGGDVNLGSGYQGFDNYSIAMIGNFGGKDTSEAGNIAINTNGGALNVDSTASISMVRIGNWEQGGTNGTISGDIQIDAGAVTLEAGTSSGVVDFAEIGTGTFHAGGQDSGALSGNIDINATSLLMNTDVESGTSTAQTRIGDLGNGLVTGDINITTAGDITIEANEGGGQTGLASIGSVSLDPSQQGLTGNITIQSGGNISLLATDSGEARIEAGGMASGSIDVTAQGDILLSDQAGSGSAANGFTEIGTLTGNADISVTSLTGKIELDANEDGSAALIGNSQNAVDFPITGNVSVTAQNVDMSATGLNARSQIGNEGGTSAISGDVTVTAANQLSLNSDQVLIGNTDFGLGTGFSGNVVITAGTLNGNLSSDFLNDIPNGDFTLDVTSSSPFILNEVLDYSSSHNATLITGGDLLIAASIQNSGTGNVTIDAGGSLEIGGNRAAGNVAVGSAGGLTTVTADNILVDALNGYAQLGYHGAGQGDIDVSATGDITVQSDIENYAGIGNGGIDVDGQNIGGNISVSTNGGAITLTSDYLGGGADPSFAMIGNMGGLNSSEAGNIGIDTNGGALNVDAVGSNSAAQIGNRSIIDSAQTASGNITVDAGAVTISSGTGTSFQDLAAIGNGSNADGGLQGGALSGNIVINAASLTVTGDGSNGTAYSTIGNFGTGDVAGDIQIATTGDITLQSDGTGSGLAFIGDFSAFTGTTRTGNITVQSGGKLSLLAADGGFTAIRGDESGSGFINVTAQGDILLSDVAGSGAGATGAAEIGDAGNGDVTVTSVNGKIELDAVNDSAFVGIGDLAGSGNITVSAQNITLSANGQDALADIGNRGFGSAISGNVTLTAANQLTIDNGTNVVIGNQSVFGGGPVSGNVSITAATLKGDITPNLFLNAIPNGDFTLDLTGNSTIILPIELLYASSHNLTFENGGNIVFDGSVQNSGTGDIDIVSGGQITIGGQGARGDVAIGSFGGTTTLNAASVLLDAANGFAQLGYNGGGASGNLVVDASGNVTLAGSTNGSCNVCFAQIGNGGEGSSTQGTNAGNITVQAGGDVSLTGGASDDAYAQIGNGGAHSTGSDSGNITITAQRNVTLQGGASGRLAYAQIGHGGARSNLQSAGYQNAGLVTVTGEAVTLAGGAAAGSYAQIGHGGFDSGDGLTGNGVNSGDIVVNALASLSLTGGGADAYAQIGNGGDQVNANAAQNATGSNEGNITVSAAGNAGAVTLTAGTGDHAYAQIGNGGYGSDAPTQAIAANFTDGGDIVINGILSLTGSDTGSGAYAQVGNGDASKSNVGDVSGNITLNGGGLQQTRDGKASGAPALIGNATGNGTVSGTVEGGTEEDAQTVAVIETLLQQNEELLSIVQPDLMLEQLTAPEGTEEAALTPPLSPLELLAGPGAESSEGEEPSDQVAEDLGHSLDKRRKKSRNAETETIIPGVLKEFVRNERREPHGVPPADQDYLSWGNEALWQW